MKGIIKGKSILKNTDETRYDTKNVKVSHITIDGKFYHATFK